MSEESIPVLEHDTYTFATSDDLLAYSDVGPRDGVPLVLLHSAFVDHTQFDALVPALVDGGHRVIAPDARGHGASANASRPFRQADDLAALLRHLDLGTPAVLVGLSMGALIAVDTAIEHPGLVRGLIIGPWWTGDVDAGDAWSVARAQAQSAALAAGDIPAWLDEFAAWIPGPTRTFADVDPAIVERVKAMALRTLMKHTPDEPDYRIPVEGLLARARSIAVPVLAVSGGLDLPGALVTVAAVVDAVPGARSLSMPEAGHYTAMEQPEEYARMVMEFVRGLG